MEHHSYAEEHPFDVYDCCLFSLCSSVSLQKRSIMRTTERLPDLIFANRPSMLTVTGARGPSSVNCCSSLWWVGYRLCLLQSGHFRHSSTRHGLHGPRNLHSIYHVFPRTNWIKGHFFFKLDGKIEDRVYNIGLQGTMILLSVRVTFRKRWFREGYIYEVQKLQKVSVVQWLAKHIAGTNLQMLAAVLWLQQAQRSTPGA